MADEPAPPPTNPVPAPGTPNILTPGQNAAAVADGKPPVEPPAPPVPPTEPPKPPEEPAKPDAKPTVDVKAFKLPEGFKADDPTLTSFAALANEHKLTQDAAQKLVDMHTAALKQASEASSKYWGDKQKEWETVNKAEYGPVPTENPKITAVAKLIDSLGEKPAAELRDALVFSGMGNNPAVVKAFVLLAERLTEPGHARGTPPSGRPATAAEALYGPPKTGT